MAVTKRGNKYQCRFQHKGQRFSWSFFCAKEARDWEVQQTKRLECGLPVEYPGQGTKETVKAGRKKDLGTPSALLSSTSQPRAGTTTRLAGSVSSEQRRLWSSSAQIDGSRMSLTMRNAST